MKKLLALLLLVCSVAVGQDSITPTTNGYFTKIVYEWTSDSSGNASGVTSDNVPGLLYQITTSPSAVAIPTDNYDIVLQQVFVDRDGASQTLATDVANSLILNRDTATTEQVEYWPSTFRKVSGKLKFTISNAGNAKQGRIEAYVFRSISIEGTTSGSNTPIGGVSGQILQWESTGTAKWITISGDATIADGGAITISGSSTGDFDGPAGATDNAVVRFDGATGKTGQNSQITIDDDGLITDGTGTLTLSDDVLVTGTIGLRGTVSNDTGNLAIVDNTDITGDVTISGTLTIAGANAIVGSVGATDNRLVRSDGTGTKTVQSTGITVDDSNNTIIPGTLDQQGDVSDSTGTFTIADTTAMTGITHAFGASGNASVALSLNAVAGGAKTLEYYTGSSRRWSVRTDTDAESGSDAGATFRISAFTDASGFIDNAVSIARVAGGTFTLNRPLDANSSITSGSGNVLVTTTTGNLALTAPAGTAATTKIVGSDGTNTAWLTPKTKPFIMGARSGEPATTNGCAAPSKTTAAGGREYYTLSFADDADRIAQWETVLPADYNGGTVTCTFYWTVASGSGTVIWGVQACSSTDDETIDQAYGTAVETTDTIIAAADEHVVTSSAVTIGGSPAAGHTVNFRVYRQNSDTATVAALLRAVKCEYTPLPY